MASRRNTRCRSFAGRRALVVLRSAGRLPGLAYRRALYSRLGLARQAPGAPHFRRTCPFARAGLSCGMLVRLRIGGGRGDAGWPALIGHRRSPGSTGSRRETRIPRPRGRYSPARAQGAVFTPLTWSPTAARAGRVRLRSPATPGLGGASRRVPRDLPARSHHPRAVEHRDCPPCGGDARIIAQVRRCGISSLEIFLGL
jgi:hypothetical protein